MKNLLFNKKKVFFGEHYFCRVRMSVERFLMIFYPLITDCDKDFDVESGEITSSTISNYGRRYCLYSIKVPKGRRITLEVIKGKSIVKTCEVIQNALIENSLKEYLAVSVNVLIYPIISLHSYFDIDGLKSKIYYS